MSTPSIAVIDTGSAYTRFGFAGDNAPRCTYSTEVGRSGKHSGGQDPNKVYIAEELEQKRKALHVNVPVRRGQIANYVDCYELWAHGFQDELRVDPGDCIVITGMRPKHTAEERKELCETFFEKLQVKGFYS